MNKKNYLIALFLFFVAIKSQTHACNTISSNASTGIIYSGSTYIQSDTCSWLIQPTGATSITFNLGLIGIGNGYDRLVFYDGPNNTYPILRSFNCLCNAGYFTSNGGVVYVEHITSCCGNYQNWGFDIGYRANFSAPQFCVSNLNAPCNGVDYIKSVYIPNAYTGTFSTCNSQASAYNYYPPIPNLTNAAYVTRTYTYEIKVMPNSLSDLALWIDYNHNHVFDASEYSLIANNAPANVFSSVFVTIPSTSLLDTTYMRVRSRVAGAGIAATDACTYFSNGETEDHVLRIFGQPQPPEAHFSIQNSNINVGQVANFIDESVNNPSSYSWTFSGATPSTSTNQNVFNVTYNTAGCFDARLVVTNGLGIDTLTKTCAVNVSPYCTPDFNAGASQGDYINSVSLGTISNLNTATIYTSYKNYTNSTLPNLSTNLARYSSNTLTLESGTQVDSVAVWIDYNQDGDFNDNGEKITQFSSYLFNHNYAINFVVPPSAALGQTRMRITCARLFQSIGNVNPCSVYYFGSCQDYTVNITNGVPPIPIAAFTSNIVNIQAGGAVNFSDLSTNFPASWAWTFTGAATSSSSAQNPSNIIYNNVGCFPVSLTVTNATGNNTSTQTCYINVTPAAPSCSELFFSEYIEGTGSNRALEIYNPSSNSINLAGYSVSLYNNGATVASNTLNLSGIIAPNDVYVIANANANATILANADVTNAVCQFTGNDALALSKNGLIVDLIGEIGVNPGTQWTVGSGATVDFTLVRKSAVTGPTSAWSTSQLQWNVFPIGTTTYLGSNSSNCSLITTAPTAAFTANSNTINVGSTINFLDLSTGNPTSWQWTFPGGTPATSTLQNPIVTYNSVGTFSVTLTATNAVGSNSSSVSNYIQVNSITTPPVANFTSNVTNINVASSVTFTNQSTNGATSFIWSFPGGTPSSSTQTNPIISYNTVGTYSVTLIAISSAGSDTMIQQSFITVNPSMTGCNELFFSEYYEGSANDKAVEIYNPTSTSINLSSYSVSLHANGGTTATSSFNLSGTLAPHDVFVLSNASANATILALADATNGVCGFNGNDAIVLKNNGNIIDVIGEVGVNPGTSWTVGTGSTLDNTLVRNASVSGPATSWTTSQTQWTNYPLGTTTYLGSHTSNCATVATLPTASFTYSPSIVCPGSNVSFTNTTTNATTYSWTFSGGTPSTSTSQNPTVLWATSGTKTITLVATNASGSNTSIQTITINASPAASTISASGATTFCSGGSVTLSGNAGGTWSTAATTSSISVSQAGSYSVTNTNSCGSTTSNTIVVTVNSAPTASTISASGATTFCSGGSVTLSGNIGGTWSTGVTTSSISVNQTGTYSVTNTNSCGSATSNNIVVTVNPLPTASTISSSGATTFCAGGSVTLSGNIGGTWSTGVTTSSISVNQTGTYSVTNTNSCGSATSNNIVVNVNPLPTSSTISASGATTFCSGGSVTLSGNVGGTWSTGVTTSSISVNQSGTYSVTNTNSCGSTTSNNIVVNVNPLPTSSTISASGATTFCAGGSVTLSGNVGGTWSTGATTPSILVNQSGTYSLTNTNSCGSTTSNSIVVSIVSVDTSVTLGNASILANATNASYQWLLCNGIYSVLPSETSQTFTPTQLAAFYAVAVTQNGCTDTSACYPIILTSIKLNNQNPNSDFSIFPNPANLSLSIHGILNQTIFIQNILGETIFTKVNCDTAEIIDVSAFAKGVYFVKVDSKILKFIKQ